MIYIFEVFGPWLVYLFVVVTFVLAVILFWLFIDLRIKLRLIFGGKMPKSEDDLLKNFVSRMMRSETRLDALENQAEKLEKSAKISIQKTGFKRYNPFSETGSDQSFTIAFLDQNNDGVMISSLYLRDGVRVYGKKIAGGISKQPLSEEEEEVLKNTLQK